MATEHAAPPSDDELVARVRAGSEEAFAALVARYETPLRRHCARIVDAAAAEDAVQETFVAAWDTLRRGVVVERLRPWLYTVARRKALAVRSRALPAADVELDAATAVTRSCAEVADSSARARAALAAVAALPARQREALVRSAVHGQSGRQIARALGVPEAVAHQLVFRGRAGVRGAAALAPLPLAVLRLLRRAARRASVPGKLAAPGIAVKAGVVAVVAVVAVSVDAVPHSRAPRHPATLTALTAASATAPAPARSRNAAAHRTPHAPATLHVSRRAPLVSHAAHRRSTPLARTRLAANRKGTAAAPAAAGGAARTLPAPDGVTGARRVEPAGGQDTVAQGAGRALAPVASGAGSLVAAVTNGLSGASVTGLAGSVVQAAGSVVADATPVISTVTSTVAAAAPTVSAVVAPTVSTITTTVQHVLTGATGATGPTGLLGAVLGGL